MKKVLVIANIFHASPRIPGMLSYLKEFGWQPTLMTVPFTDKEAKGKLALPIKFQDVEVFTVKYIGDIFFPIRRFLKFVGFKKDQSDSFIQTIGNSTKQKKLVEHLAHYAHLIFAYPDTEITWIIPALKASKELNIGDYDCVLSSSPHPTVHIIASKINHNIPWVADFRDPWTQNHVYPYPPIRRYFERKLELDIIKSACFLTGATETMSKKQFNLHNKPYKIIYNGYDPESIIKMPLLPKFTISYTGTIYENKQQAEKFLVVLKELLDTKQIQDIDVRFYGNSMQYLRIK